MKFFEWYTSLKILGLFYNSSKVSQIQKKKEKGKKEGKEKKEGMKPLKEDTADAKPLISHRTALVFQSSHFSCQRKGVVGMQVALGSLRGIILL